MKRSGLARLIALDDRILRRLVRSRRARIVFLLRTLCRLYDPDMVIMGISVALFAQPLVTIANQAGLALIFASLLVVVIKRAVRRRRPALDVQASTPPDKFSFPSGHTAAAFALAIAMFGAAPALVPPLFVLALVVGYARMYIGVHYPLDVLAGAAVGLVVGAVLAVVELPARVLLPFALPGIS